MVRRKECITIFAWSDGEARRNACREGGSSIESREPFLGDFIRISTCQLNWDIKRIHVNPKLKKKELITGREWYVKYVLVYLHLFGLNHLSQKWLRRRRICSRIFLTLKMSRWDHSKTRTYTYCMISSC